MKLTIDTTAPQIQAALKDFAEQLPYAMMLAINKTAEHARGDVQTTMKQVFDRPTPWAINSLRIKYATKTQPGAELAYKDRASAGSARTMLEPHVYAGSRHYKALEARLRAANYLPSGYNAVPGSAATLDTYGNMSAAQINQILNVIGTYFDPGTGATVKRLKKGTRKTYGFTYWVNRIASGITHLHPGIYKRTYTAWGTALQPVIIFVNRATYKDRFDFYGVARTTFNTQFPSYFDDAFKQAIKTAFPK